MWHTMTQRLVPIFALLVACGGSSIVDEGAGGAGSSANAANGSNGSNGSTGSTGNSTGTGGVNFGSCDGAGQCMLQVPGCCGVCGEPQLSDFDAINQAQSQAHFDATCTEDDPICPGCATMPNPNVFAYCDMGTCVGVDMTTSDFNECETQDDCRLRNGLECCECGSGQGWTAVPNDFVGTLGGLVCPPDSGCPECEPQPPEDAVALCTEGRCVIAYKN